MTIDFREVGDHALSFITVPEPFDIEQAKAELSVHEEAIKQMLEQSKEHQITDETSNKAAIQMGLQAKKLSKKIKAMGADKTKEHRDFVSAVRNMVKLYTDMLDSIETGLKAKFREYSRIKEMERREAEKKAQEVAKRLQEKVNKEAEEKGIEPVQVPDVALPEKQQPVRTEEGSASVRKRWTWDKESVDFAQVPDEYKTIDAVAINRAIRAGLRNIPGIRIYQEEEAVWRG